MRKKAEKFSATGQSAAKTLGFHRGALCEAAQCSRPPG